jgi:hypothetical protein
MADPVIHAMADVKRWGGKVEDYLPIHELMDGSKKAFPDNRHRALTHHSHFVNEILPRIFGRSFRNSDNRLVIVKDVGERHCIEDLGYIPAASDYLAEVEPRPWMSGHPGDAPPSARRVAARRGHTIRRTDMEAKAVTA